MTSLTPLCHVQFLGFRAQVMDLQNSGWDVSLLQERRGYDVVMAMALEHKALNMRAVSRVLREDIHKFLSPDLLPTIPELIFHVEAVAPNINICNVSMNVQSVSFSSVSFEPSMETITSIDLATVLPFKPEKPQEIIVDPSEVSMWLDKLLDAQAPQQKEIRQKRIVANLSTF